MIKTAAPDKRKSAWQIGSISFFAYCMCYVAKTVLSALQPQIEAEKYLDYSALGMMGSALLLAYGVGQLINGLIGIRVSAKWMVFLGLSLAGVSLLLFPVFHSVPLLVALWGACGFLCSMLWGPLAALIGENNDERTGRILLTALRVASILGSFLSYLMALISAVCASWRLAFYLGGALMAAGGVLWFFVCVSLEKKGVIRTRRTAQDEPDPSSEPVDETEREKTVSAETPADGIKKTRFSVRGMCNIGFLFMALTTMVCGILRNAITLWVPTIIVAHLSFSASVGAAVSTALPFVNLGGTFFSLWGLRLFRNNEKLFSAVMFTLTALAFGALALFGTDAPVAGVVFLFLACAVVSTVYNLIFCVYILRFKETGAISAISGFMDFNSYFSAALFNLVFFTPWTDAGAWRTFMIACVALAAAGVAFALISALSRRDYRPAGR